MNRLFYFLLVGLGAALGLYLAWPWFYIAIVALAAAPFFRMRRRAGFWFAFLAALFVWGAYLSYISISNDGILADRMANLFQLPSGWLMIIVTSIWGAITAGLGGWTGTNLRKVLKQEKA